MNPRYKTLRKETQLLLEQGEGPTVDFKRNEKVSAEDFVAFANSTTGGHILLGIDEVVGKDQRQRGVPYENGITLTDELILKLQTKADNCVPPVFISITEENTSKIPVVRIDIPPSPHVPHCTQAGVYKIRGVAGNSPLLPKKLLDIFLSTEASQFFDRFQESTRLLESSLDNISDQLNNSIKDMGESVVGTLGLIVSDLNETQESLHDSFSSLHATSDEAHQFADETLGTTDEVHNVVLNLDRELQNQSFDIAELGHKIDSILINDGITDRSLRMGHKEQKLAVDILSKQPKDKIKAKFLKQYPTANDEIFEQMYSETSKSINEVTERK